MNNGIPWQVKGVRPEARDTAREAARRSGLSVGEWLNNVIFGQAGREGVAPPPTAPDIYADDDLYGEDRRMPAGGRPADFSQQAAGVPNGTSSQGFVSEDSRQVAEEIVRLNRRLDRLMSESRAPAAAGQYREPAPAYANPQDPDRALNQAIAEIAARQQTLDWIPPPPAAPPPPYAAPPYAAPPPLNAPLPPYVPPAAAPAPMAPPPPAAPPAPPMAAPAPPAPPPPLSQRPPAHRDVLPRPATQDLGGLELQLRQITTQIESLRVPQLADAIATIRRELGDIARTLQEAVPRRSIEALEMEIRSLGERIDRTRNNGADAASLAALERGLTEMREAVRALMPAENLGALHFTIENLATKVDAIANGNQEPGALQRLEEAVAVLREMASHVASNEALNQLADEMRSLAINVDRVARSANHAEILSNIDQRISSLTQALEANRNGGEEASRFESVTRSLIESVTRSVDESVARSLSASMARNLDASAARGLDDSVARNLIESVTRSVDESVARSLNQSAARGLDDSVARNLIESVTRSVDESVARSLNQSAARGFDDSVARNLIESVTRSVDESVARSLNESVARSLDESVARSLNDKLEKLSLSRSDHAAVGVLEDRIAKLIEKLDASGARLNHLEAIEHGLAELLVHLEQQRAQNVGTVREPPAAPAEVGSLQRDIDEIKQIEQRTHDSLEAAHNTLGAVVDRLAMIETDLRAAPASTPRPHLTSPLPDESSHAAPPQPAERRPIDPTLPPDHPLEPGLGASPSRPSTPAERIAASEAVLARAKPPVIPDPGTKGDFIAAARRAAQAASQTAAADARPVRPKGARPTDPDDEPQPPGGIVQRVRSLFVGAAAVVIVGGSLAFTVWMVGPINEMLAMMSGPRVTATATAPATTDDGPSASAPVRITAPARPPAAGDVTGSIAPATTPAPSGDSRRQTTRSTDLPDSFGPTLRTLAASGDGAAAFEVANRYAEGRGVPQSAEEALRWFERAANQGLAPAQFRLAGLYEKGIGVKKNLDMARRLYGAAAEAGNGKAMHNLAVLHAEGIDGKPDYRTALHWFRRGADHGVTDSQYNLGVLYARGIGVEINLAESYKWFALAARDGDKDAARKRDDVGARLDPPALEAARLAVQSWMPHPEPRAAVEVPAPPGGWDAGSERQSAPAPANRVSATGGPLQPLPVSRRSSAQSSQ